MPIDVVMSVSALVFGVIAAAWFYESYHAHRQANAESIEREREKREAPRMLREHAEWKEKFEREHGEHA